MTISKHSFNQCTSLIIRNGPSGIDNTGFVPMKARQASELLCAIFLNCGCSSPRIRSSLRVVISWAPVQAGITEPILTHPVMALHCLTLEDKSFTLFDAICLNSKLSCKLKSPTFLVPFAGKTLQSWTTQFCHNASLGFTSDSSTQSDCI